MSKHVVIPYMLTGGAITLSYQLIFDFLHYHQTNTDRPLIADHFIATCTIGTVIGAFMGGMPRYAVTGFVASLFLIAPMTWWLYKQGRFNSQNRPANIFYQNDCTPEEIQRI